MSVESRFPMEIIYSFINNYKYEIFDLLWRNLSGDNYLYLTSGYVSKLDYNKIIIDTNSFIYYKVEPANLYYMYSSRDKYIHMPSIDAILRMLNSCPGRLSPNESWLDSARSMKISVKYLEVFPMFIDNRYVYRFNLEGHGSAVVMVCGRAAFGRGSSTILLYDLDVSVEDGFRFELSLERPYDGEATFSGTVFVYYNKSFYYIYLNKSLYCNNNDCHKNLIYTYEGSISPTTITLSRPYGSLEQGTAGSTIGRRIRLRGSLTPIVRVRGEQVIDGLAIIFDPIRLLIQAPAFIWLASHKGKDKDLLRIYKDALLEHGESVPYSHGLLLTTSGARIVEGDGDSVRTESIIRAIDMFLEK